MKVVLQCVTLSVILTLCFCYESYESNESPEASHVFVNQHRANSFLPNQERSTNNQYDNYRFGRVVKTQAERQAERCEDYQPCRNYAFHNGYQKAYQRYFSN